MKGGNVNFINPTEAQEAEVFVAWLRLNNLKFTHIPNETGGTQEAKRRAIRMKRQGTSRGFVDYLVLLPKVGILAIELKRPKGGKVSPEQQEWIDALNECPGVAAFVAHGSKQAIATVEAYWKTPARHTRETKQDSAIF